MLLVLYIGRAGRDPSDSHRPNLVHRTNQGYGRVVTFLFFVHRLEVTRASDPICPFAILIFRELF